LSNRVFYDHHTRAEEEAWVRENGPFSPDLVEAVRRARDRFDLFLFYCYRYYHSWAGLPGVGDKALLVPTAEEDPAVQLAIFKPLFNRPRGIVYLTPEEQALVEGVSGNREVPSAVIGSGLDLPEPGPEVDFTARHRLARPFVLYVGRIDRMKGCLTLFAYYKKFLEDTGLEVDLVLAGRPTVKVPDHPGIRAVGFISEEEKVAALRQCRLLVVPSPYESLSVITLEAWKLGVPVLANAKCRVLAGQCRRSNGGLFYEGYAEFAAALEMLLTRPEVGEVLGRQGQEYVEAEYSWDRVEAKLEDLFARVRRVSSGT
jgi:glycosyltransferase involved in cell wall biosynthesis